jgi:acetylornithine deacetylase
VSRTIDYLERLIAFATVSRDSNLDLIAYVRGELEPLGFRCMLAPSEDGRKANLYASIGPQDVPGIVLSGHSDVVPVEGQAWSSDPFKLRKADGKLFGRGSVDMKGFIAACMSLAHDIDAERLAAPLHFAFSYDEEVGCLGVRRLIDMLDGVSPRPRFCIVGEPTSMQVAVAHKGKDGAKVSCIGLEAHSSLAPLGINAIHLAIDLINEIRAVQADVAETGARDGDYDVPYTTLHVGKIAGGEALNIVPNLATFEFEIRNIADENPKALMDRIRKAAERIENEAQKVFPGAAINFAPGISYPALNTPPDADVVSFVKSLTGGNSTTKISFGTEGGLFDQRLGIPTVVCGPGSIAVAHKPDEYIEESQLAACETMLAKLHARMVQA